MGAGGSSPLSEMPYSDPAVRTPAEGGRPSGGGCTPRAEYGCIRSAQRTSSAAIRGLLQAPGKPILGRRAIPRARHDEGEQRNVAAASVFPEWVERSRTPPSKRALTSRCSRRLAAKLSGDSPCTAGSKLAFDAHVSCRAPDGYPHHAPRRRVVPSAMPWPIATFFHEVLGTVCIPKFSPGR